MKSWLIEVYYQIQSKLIWKSGVTGQIESKYCGCVLEEDYRMMSVRERLGLKEPLKMWHYVLVCGTHEIEQAKMEDQFNTVEGHRAIWEDVCECTDDELEATYFVKNLRTDYERKVRKYLKELGSVDLVRAVKKMNEDKGLDFWIDTEIHKRELLGLE